MYRYFIIILILLAGCTCGQGEQEFSVAGALGLIQQDDRGSVQDWSFLLATHGYDVPVVGFLVLNETEYQITENGSLEVA